MKKIGQFFTQNSKNLAFSFHTKLRFQKERRKINFKLLYRYNIYEKMKKKFQVGFLLQASNILCQIQARVKQFLH